MPTGQYKDPFIASLVDFVAADDFQKLFETFFLEHSLSFSLENDEHKLAYYEKYSEFRELFEQKLVTFCKQQNLNTNEFMRKCKEASAVDSKVQHYIDVLLASVEYETFYKIMKVMRPVAERKIQLSRMRADGKPSSSSDLRLKGAKESSESIKPSAPDAKSETKPVATSPGKQLLKKGEDDDDEEEDSKSSKAGAK